MFRALLIYLSKAGWAQRMITSLKIARMAAGRFVAGNSIDDAIRVVREFNQKGINATLDHLGESTETGGEAINATEDILKLLDQILASHIRANVSIKLSQIGLSIDQGLCENNLEKILERTRDHSNFIRIDMEDTPYTDQTLHLYRKMRSKGYKNTGIVIQSYLYRTENDTRQLLSENSRIRLVKGAYKEPPELAFIKKGKVDENFDELTAIILDAIKLGGSPILSEDGLIPPILAIGSHDPKRIEFAKNYASKLGVPKKAIEFQMLYGIRRDLQEQCLKEGYPVRIYVPYGTHWYPYYMRRLAERPANLWFFISNFFRK
jgi:proline dehydrogenase